MEGRRGRTAGSRCFRRSTATLSQHSPAPRMDAGAGDDAAASIDRSIKLRQSIVHHNDNNNNVGYVPADDADAAGDDDGGDDADADGGDADAADADNAGADDGADAEADDSSAARAAAQACGSHSID